MALRWSPNVTRRPLMLAAESFNPAERAYPFGNQDFEEDERTFIEVTPESVTFVGQRGPIKEAGINGCQIDDMITFALGTLQVLNKKFPCRENSLAITKLEEALHWLDARERDRAARGVEGRNKE
jgi:hypothetical protein